MAISSLLDIPGDHVWSTEGPLYLALAYADLDLVPLWPDEKSTPSTTRGLVTGPMSLNPPVAGDTTGDLLAAGSARPVHHASSAAFNGKPTIEFDGVDDLMKSIAFTVAMTEPVYVLAVARLTLLDPFSTFFQNLSFTANPSALAANNTAAPNTKWRIGGPANSTDSAATADTAAHLFRLQSLNFGEKLWVDEVSVINAAVNLGGNAGDYTGLAVGNRADAAAGTFGFVEFAHISLRSTDYTAGEKSDAHAFCQSHYGTP